MPIDKISQQKAVTTSQQAAVATAPAPASATVAQQSGSIATLPHVAAADRAALYGTSKAAVPDLLGDWRRATVKARIKELAMGLLQPNIEAALESAASAVGRPLEPDEVEEVAEEVFEQNKASALAVIEPMVRASPASEERAFNDAIGAWRPQLAFLKDLQPMILNVSGARAKEVVLWESPRALVVADTFSRNPKALVFPKPPVELPIDLSAAELANIAKIAAQVGAAFRDVEKTSKPEIWVNAPQHLWVRQLHVHVQPHLANWKDVAGDDKAAVRKAKIAMYGQLQAALAQRLGPSV